MIKEIITIIITLVMCAYLVDLKITFDPFSISLGKWKTMLGYIIVGVGIALIAIDIKKEAFIEGGEYTIKEIRKELRLKK